MNWIKLTEDNIPHHKVLCFDGYDFMVGYIYKSVLSANSFAAEDEGQIMYDVTHFCYLEAPDRKE